MFDRAPLPCKMKIAIFCTRIQSQVTQCKIETTRESAELGHWFVMRNSKNGCKSNMLKCSTVYILLFVFKQKTSCRTFTADDRILHAFANYLWLLPWWTWLPLQALSLGGVALPFQLDFQWVSMRLLSVLPTGILNSTNSPHGISSEEYVLPNAVLIRRGSICFQLKIEHPPSQRDVPTTATSMSFPEAQFPFSSQESKRITLTSFSTGRTARYAGFA